MKRWWNHSSVWGWVAYESARARGERVAFGMLYAYFTTEAPGRYDGRRAARGSMVFGEQRL